MNIFNNLNQNNLKIDFCISNRNYICRNIVLPNNELIIDYSKSPINGLTNFAYFFGENQFQCDLYDINNNKINYIGNFFNDINASEWIFSNIDNFITYSDPQFSGKVIVKNLGNNILYIVSFNPTDYHRLWEHNLYKNDIIIETENILSYQGYIIPIIGSCKINGEKFETIQKPYKCFPGKTYNITESEYPFLYVKSIKNI